MYLVRGALIPDEFRWWLMLSDWQCCCALWTFGAAHVQGCRTRFGLLDIGVVGSAAPCQGWDPHGGRDDKLGITTMISLNVVNAGIFPTH